MLLLVLMIVVFCDDKKHILSSQWSGVGMLKYAAWMVILRSRGILMLTRM